MSAIIYLFIAGFVLWFWYDSMRARELAIDASSAACARMNAQFLDQTVVLTRLRLCRTPRGKMSLCRLYVFDITIDGTVRRTGVVKMIGHQIVELVLDIDHASLLQ